MISEKKVDPAEKKQLNEKETEKVSGGDFGFNIDLDRLEEIIEKQDQVQYWEVKNKN